MSIIFVILVFFSVHKLECVENDWKEAFNCCETFYDYWHPDNENCFFNADFNSNTPDMITRHGFPVESHLVTTEDGYILTMFRIPNNGSNDESALPPILLQHGAGQDSSIWVDIGKRSLAFKLSNMGYDVWLGNTRGNSYSQEHLYLTITQKAFWEYTLDDIAHYDLSAVFATIYSKTASSGKLIYVGHSQGTTISYMYSTRHQSDADKYLKGLVAVAPVAYLTDLPIVKKFKFLPNILTGLMNFGLYSLGFDMAFNQALVKLICLATPDNMEFCSKFYQLVYGPAGDQYTAVDFPIMSSYIYNRESLKPYIQYSQIAFSNKFQAFDYEEFNMEKYGSFDPPVYNLSKITLPVFLFYGDNDYLASPSNVIRLYNELTTKKKFMKAVGGQYSPFNHNAFLYGKDIETLLYPALFRAIGQLRNE